MACEPAGLKRHADKPTVQPGCFCNWQAALSERQHPDFKGDLPQQVKDDIDAFINGMEDENIDMKNVGLKGQKKEDVLAEIARIYLDKEG